MTLTTGNMVGRLISTGTDDLGRWSRQSFHGKSGKRITILHVYQTPRSTIKPGQVTAAAQQYSLLRQQPGEQNLSPRNTFARDFSHLLGKLIGNKHSVLVLGDFNEDIHHHQSTIAHALQAHHLVDIHQHRHPQNKPPATYIRGTRCIDYALCTRDILPAVTQSGYLPFNEHLPSDHRALFIDLDTNILFGNAQPHISSPKLRRLKSTSPK